MVTLLFILMTDPFPTLNLEDYEIYQDNWVMFYHLPGTAHYLVQAKFQNKLLLFDAQNTLIKATAFDRNILEEPVVLGIRNDDVLVANHNGSVVALDFQLNVKADSFPKLPIPLPLMGHYHQPTDTFSVVTPNEIVELRLKQGQWVIEGKRSEVSFVDYFPDRYLHLHNDLAYELYCAKPGEDRYQVKVFDPAGDMIMVLQNRVPEIDRDHKHFVSRAAKSGDAYYVHCTITDKQYHREQAYLDVYASNGDLRRSHIEVPTALTLRTIDNSEELLFINRETMKCEPFGTYLPSEQISTNKED